MKKRILAICGMHRSGTSLITSYLESAGLFVGDNQVEASYGNPKGHFEDYAFVNLQEEILQKNGIKLHVDSKKEIKFTSEQRRAVWQLLSSRAQLLQWGWKDPRTALFLDFWKKEIPELKACVIFRDYSAVVDSLLRRARSQTAAGPKKWLVPVWHSAANHLLVNKHLSTWIAYNKRMLAFAEKWPDDCCVIELSGWLNQPDQLPNYLTDRWDFQLGKADSSIYEAEQLGKDAETKKLSFKKSLLTEADDLQRSLRMRSICNNGKFALK